MNGFIDVRIKNRVITKSDIAMICYDGDRSVTLDDCYVENLDVSTMNPRIAFFDCMFYNSKLVLPSPHEQLHGCIFKGVETGRTKVRQAKTLCGYHTPVLPPRYS